MVKSSLGVTPKPRFGTNLDSTGYRWSEAGAAPNSLRLGTWPLHDEQALVCLSTNKKRREQTLTTSLQNGK